MSTDLALVILDLCGGALAPRRALLEACGQPGAALAGGPRAWRAAGLSAAQAQALLHPAPGRLAQAQAWLAQPGHRVLGWHDPDYPALLRRISSPPLALFVDGEPAALWHPAVAVVGSRSPSSGGVDNARAFASGLASAGLTVASGLATGVDAAAHEGALAVPGGRTVAVLGTGPDLAYPRQHTRLRDRIAGKGAAQPPCGAVVSEHPPGTPAIRSHFPTRNRILAGLALGTLVVEAAERSGALITARQAADAGREVFAVPGSIHNARARGCHRLIREGATLVESVQEVLQPLATLAERLAEDLRGRLASTGSAQANPGPAFIDGLAPATSSPEQRRLWEALGHDPAGMDVLVGRTGLPVSVLSPLLLSLELEGRVCAEYGRYARQVRAQAPTPRAVTVFRRPA